MIIEQSMITMSAEHQKSESVSFISKSNISAFGQQFIQARSALDEAAETALFFDVGVNSPEQENAILMMTENGLEFRAVEEGKAAEMQQSYTQARLFKALFEAITGTKLPVINEYSGLQDNQEAVSESRIQRSAATDFMSEVKTVKMTVNLTQLVEEHESMKFSAGGIIKTSDGAEISLDLAMMMERQYSATESVSFSKEVRFKDPILLNFDGSSAVLSDESFAFDIDADGESEWLSYLTGANGWLGLDKNNNGKIDDGSELFGGLTGQGFEELSRYDEDNNGFIDAADAVFDDLLIWRKSMQSEQLLSLEKSHIGAIFTGSEETDFDLKNDTNQMIGRVIKSGLYVSDSGAAGLVQQIDMAV